jgi:hypothetical protein
MEQVKQYFENHETVNQLYFTSDGLAFFDEVNAMNHAGNLDDTTISTKTRDEVESELDQLTDGLEYDPLDEPDAE